MKMLYLTTIASGVATLVVLLAFITGIFFVVLTGLRWVSRVRETLYEEEFRRQQQLLNSYMTSNDCSSFKEVRNSNFDLECVSNKTGIQEKTEKPLQSDTKSIVDKSNNSHSEEKSGEEQEKISSETVKVRELIEKLVETIIGGSLDGTIVGKLSNHSAYLSIFTKYHSLLCRELARLGLDLQQSVVHENCTDFDSSNSTHSSLKKLITKVINEAMSLPNINEISCRPKTTKEEDHNDYTKNKSYEDILATAILNKIIDKYQKKNENETPPKRKPRTKGRKLKKNNEDVDLSSNSDWSDSSRSDKLSLTIEEYIEEVTTAYEISDEEKCDLSDYEGSTSRSVPFPESGRVVRDAGTDDENSDAEHSSVTELVTSTSSWEENWLFQKKRLRSTPNVHHPVPVPMLVPNPSEDFRALVGGVDADDLSDMSDCSDSVLEDLIDNEESSPVQPQENEHTSLTHHDNEVFGTNEKQEKVDEKGEIKDLVREDVELKEDVTDASLDLKTQKTGEIVDETHVEKYSTITEEAKTSPLSLTPPEVISQKDRELAVEDFELLHQCESANSEPSLDRNHLYPDDKSDEVILNCEIAKREKEKWNNPVPLTVNPYSLESIGKREKNNKMEYFRVGCHSQDYIDFPYDLTTDDFSKRKAENQRFRRDYYINASKHPSGTSFISSLSHHSDGYDQNFPSNESKTFSSDNVKDLTIEKMQDKNNNNNNNSSVETKVIRRAEFSLPNVKELAKQFTVEVTKKENGRTSIHSETGAKSESKKKASRTYSFPHKREPEIDYSLIPVSKIILDLEHAFESPLPKSQKYVLHDQAQPHTQMIIYRKNSNNSTKIANCTDKVTKKTEESNAIKFNGKQVHSLTARSMSKEFREGLKCNSNHKKFTKKSSEESDQDVIVNEGKSSPTPSIDLKNMRKFWEEIITSNSKNISKNS